MGFQKSDLCQTPTEYIDGHPQGDAVELIRYSIAGLVATSLLLAYATYLIQEKISLQKGSL